jgi:hypothetical protein
MKGRRLPDANLLLAATLPGALLGAVACSSSSSSGQGDPFVGTWHCTLSVTVSYSMPTTKPVMSTMMNTNVITDDGHGNLTLVRTGDEDGGSPPCTLHSTLSADRKSINAVTPEKCPGAAGITQTITSGMSTIGSGNDTYTSEVAFTLDGTGAQGATVAATGLATGTCTKM